VVDHSPASESHFEAVLPFAAFLAVSYQFLDFLITGTGILTFLAASLASAARFSSAAMAARFSSAAMAARFSSAAMAARFSSAAMAARFSSAAMAARFSSAALASSLAFS
jgi:hypothetical protein